MLLRGKDVEKSYKRNTSARMLSDSPGKVQKVESESSGLHLSLLAAKESCNATSNGVRL